MLRGGAAENPAAAIFVPKQVAVMVSLLVNPDRLDDLLPGNRGRMREKLEQIEQSLLTDTDLDYRRDIQPWLGNEVTLAVTTPDIDRNGQNGKQPGYLLAVTTKDPAKSREFVELFWQKRAIAGTNLIYEQYQGVNLIYSNQQTGTNLQESEVQNSKKKGFAANSSAVTTGLSAQPVSSTPNYVASAVVGDRFILFANSPKVLRDAINNVQANLSLKDDPSYQRALEKLTPSRVGLTFVNLPALAGWLGNSAAKADDTTPQPYQSLAIALSPSKQGLLADTALLAASGQEVVARPPTLRDPVAAWQYIPATSGIAVAGTNLNQVWNQISSSQRDDTISQLLKSSVATLSDRWQIQLPDDIFSWVQGEYALALLPRPDRDYPDWIFVADKSAAANAEEAIEHLDAIAKKQGFSVGALPLENQTISAWTKLTTASKDGKDKGPVVLSAQVRGVHATVGKYEIFTTSIEAMNQALKAADNSLIASDKFKQAIAALPQPNDGYLYLDWGASQTFLENQLPIVKLVELIGQPLFSNLRSLCASSYGSEAGIQYSKVFFQLGTVSAS